MSGAYLRASGFAMAASLLAACSGAPSGTASPAAPLVPPQAFAGRAVLDPAAGGKIPQPFEHGGRVAHAPTNAMVACTTITPSPDVLSALEEPGSTATAAYVIDTPGGAYAKQDYDGSECDIAVYVAPAAASIKISDSTIHDGIRAGLVIDGAPNVNVTGNAIYDIGDHSGATYAPDGVQYGFGLMLDSAGTGETVSENSVYDYQKEGILAFDDVSLALTQNDVTGAGAIGYIASNGMEMDNVTFTKLARNRVSLNQYSGPTYGAAGYLFFTDTSNGTPLTKTIVKSAYNFAVFNDIEIYIQN